MSCPLLKNPGKKDEEKTIKYGPLRWELNKQYPGYNIDQCNIVIDVIYRKVVKETRADYEKVRRYKGKGCFAKNAESHMSRACSI